MGPRRTVTVRTDTGVVILWVEDEICLSTTAVVASWHISTHVIAASIPICTLVQISAAAPVPIQCKSRIAFTAKASGGVNTGVLANTTISITFVDICTRLPITIYSKASSAGTRIGTLPVNTSLRATSIVGRALVDIFTPPAGEEGVTAIVARAIEGANSVVASVVASVSTISALIIISAGFFIRT